MLFWVPAARPHRRFPMRESLYAGCVGYDGRFHCFRHPRRCWHMFVLLRQSHQSLSLRIGNATGKAAGESRRFSITDEMQERAPVIGVTVKVPVRMTLWSNRLSPGLLVWISPASQSSHSTRPLCKQLSYGVARRQPVLVQIFDTNLARCWCVWPSLHFY